MRQAKLARKRRRKPRYAVRMPKGYSIRAPGDLVQMDTLKLQLMSNDVRYNFSARDVISRWDCARAFRRQTSFAAARFLEYLETKFPFKIKAIQIDGGSEFKKDFEIAIQERQILLFVIPHRSPKLNSFVERANRMYREEFYEVETIGHTMEEHNRQLEKWQYTCNYVRPHQALDYLAPAEYYDFWLQSQRPKRHKSPERVQVIDIYFCKLIFCPHNLGEIAWLNALNVTLRILIHRNSAVTAVPN